MASPSRPPPPLGWLSGLVSGAGRLLAAVLGLDPPGCDSATASYDADASPASSRPPAPRGEGGDVDHDNSPLFPSGNNQLNQSGKEMVLKDCAEGSLAFVSEIDPKDAIMRLLMQETYLRSECDTLVKIIQERVVDSDPDGDDPGRIALPIAWQAGRQQDTATYSSFSPNTSPLATSSLPARSPDLHSNVVKEEKGWLEVKRLTPTLSPVEGPSPLNTDRIQSVLKRSYSTIGDNLDESRRVRPKLNGNLLNISKFKQVDVVRNHAGREFPAMTSFKDATVKDLNAFRGIPEDAKKRFSDVPLLGTDNLTFFNFVSKAETATDAVGLPDKPSTVNAQPFGSTSSQAGIDHNNDDSTIFNLYSNKDLKVAFSIKVEPLDALVPFKPDMMDLAQQKHDEDVKAATSSSAGVPVETISRYCRRRGGKWQKSAPTTRRPSVKGSHHQNDGITIKSDNDLLEQSKLIWMDQEPDLGHSQVKRPVGRPRKARGK